MPGVLVVGGTEADDRDLPVPGREVRLAVVVNHVIYGKGRLWQPEYGWPPYPAASQPQHRYWG